MEKYTIKDIAKESGVSLSTVSLVLNGNSRISAATREKVMAIVEKRGYQPNFHARGLASRSSRVLSVVVPNLDQVFADVYFGIIISGIYDHAQEANYKIMLDIANHRFVKEKEYMILLKTRQVDGMLYIASTLDDKYLLEFEDNDYPFLLVNHYFPKSSLNYIATDYIETAKIAANHFLNLGHKHFGVIRGSNVQTTVDMLKTFTDCCVDRGIPRKQVVAAQEEFDEPGGFQAAHYLMNKDKRISAIMAGNDRIAIGVLRYLASVGKRVPEDVSVMGVDDILQSRYSNPALTTIHHDLYKVGRLSAARLIALAKGEIGACRETIPINLVKRESTGPAP